MTERKHYTRERLIEAAARCSNIDDVIAFFGTHPRRQLRRYLLRRFGHYGIDVSHFDHRGSDTVASRPTRARLGEAVASSNSLAELLRMLGRRDNSHQRKLLRHWIAENDDLPLPGPGTPAR